MEAIFHRNLRLGKSVKKNGKIKIHTKNRHSVPSSSTAFVRVKIVRQIFILFSFFLTNTFHSLDVESFPHCSISESGCLNFQLMSFLWYLDWICQFLGSYGSHLLVVDPAKWAIRNAQPESFKLGTWRLLYPSYVNVVSGREHCSTSLFTSFVILTETFCLFRFIGSFLFCAISESGCLTFFFLISFLLSSFGVLWRPRFRRESCQVGYIAPAIWESAEA